MVLALVLSAVLLAVVGLVVALVVGLARSNKAKLAPAKEHYERLLPLLRSLGTVETWEEKQGKATIRVHAVRFDHEGRPLSLTLRGQLLSLGYPLESVGRAGGAQRGPYRGGDGEQPIKRLPVFLLRREDNVDRWAKRVRLTREAQSGNARFDEAVFVESDAVDRVVERMIASPQLQTATLELFDAGVASVSTEVTEDPLQCRWAGKAAWLDEARLRAAADSFVALAESLPPFENVEPPRWVRGELLAALSWVSASLVMFAAFFSSCQWPTVDGAAEADAFQVGLPGAAVLIVLVVLRLRGRPRALRYLVITAPAMLLVAPLTLSLVIHTVNAVFDGSRFERLATTTHRHESKGQKGGTTYYLRVEPWPPFDGDIELRVSQEVYRRHHVGSQVRVVLGRGSLGYEWIREVR